MTEADATGSRNPRSPANDIADSRPRVVVAGLGPAGPELTTPAVRELLATAPARVLRTARHPAAAPWVAEGVRTFDPYYEVGESFDDIYRNIVEDLVQMAMDSGVVVYAVPGSPAVLERTVAELRADTRVAVSTMAGLSFLDLAWDRLGIDPVNASVRLINGENFDVDAAGERGPLLVSHTWSDAILSDIKLAIEPDAETRVVICHHLGLDDERIVDVSWEDLDRSVQADHLTCLFIPHLSRPVAYEVARVADVVATLRTRCPWDAKQTHQSLVRHFLEETYEAIEAIEELGDPPDLAASELLEEELGDVLCQVLFHSTLAKEEGLFTFGDVAASLADKLIRRHPHVYATDAAGDGSLSDASVVLSNWEQQKQLEKARESLTDGIPRALPSLAYAAKLERKMATVGLGVREQPGSRSFEAVLGGLEFEGEEEVGALLLEIARRSAAVGHDPESALRRAVIRLRERFREVERRAIDAGAPLGSLEPARRRELWEAKGLPSQ